MGVREFRKITGGRRELKDRDRGSIETMEKEEEELQILEHFIYGIYTATK
jgi:hypothetical protein